MCMIRMWWANLYIISYYNLEKILGIISLKQNVFSSNPKLGVKSIKNRPLCHINACICTKIK